MSSLGTPRRTGCGVSISSGMVGGAELGGRSTLEQKSSLRLPPAEKPTSDPNVCGLSEDAVCGWWWGPASRYQGQASLREVDGQVRHQ